MLFLAIGNAHASIQERHVVIQADNVTVLPTLTEEEAKRFLSMDAQRHYYEDITGNIDIVDAVYYNAAQVGVHNVDILFAIMWKESRFDPTAKNANATSIDRGLFQLNSTMYSNYPEEYFYDIEWNIATGVRHYAAELEALNNEKLALYAYNAGRGRAHNPPWTTQNYAKQVLEQVKIFSAERQEYTDLFIQENLSSYIKSNS